ncbi:MAG: site-specific integrase [Candidatus Omnitrophica bacterium]|jgi:integrase|nr:site-specific integrase [Candidatus Omnitrophota bacterium]
MEEQTTSKTDENLKSLRLDLEDSGKEGLKQGIRTDGKKYSVRENRMSYFYPDIWLKVVNNLTSDKAKLTAETLIQTGARINEARNIRKDDIDFERNTIKLRITKTKTKKGEKKGKPRTIPINSEFIKKLKKEFKDKQDDSMIGLLSTPAFNIALKKALEKSNVKDGYMYSAHNIRKTHGNWLKILGNLRIMNIDAMEICLRLGHDYNTFLKDYGSSGVMDTKDVILIQKILGDLYRR